MSKLLGRVCVVVAVMFSTIVMSGCEEKITTENYDKIQLNVTTMSQAEELLGGKGELETTMGGSISAGGIATTEVTTSNAYSWSQGTKKITLIMKDGKVISKVKTF